jgi:putative ABC transport system substrate-binding protein
LVTSFNRPGGNVTGIYIFTATTDAKRLGLLREIVPKAKTIAVLVNSTNPSVDLQISQVEEGSRSLGLQTQIFRATPRQTFEAVFAEIAQSRADALVVCADPYFNSQRAQIVAMAARHAIPAIYEQREFATAGGLSSYGISITNAYRELGIYAARILKGEKPADLPVLQSTKFEFIINLKTAKALGITFSDNLISLADEVIE